MKQPRVEGMRAPQRVTLEPGRLFVGGRFVEAADGRTFASVNPATGEVLVEVAEAGEEDVDRAVRAARAAFDTGPWGRRLSASDRATILWRVGDLLLAHAAELAELEALDSGKPVTENARIDVPLAAECFHYFAGWCTKIQGDTIPASGAMLNYTLREPVGVCGQIIPWNFPLLMAAWKVAPALACGNTVVLKPATYTPLTALRLAALCQEAGLPDGVLNVVPGQGSVAGAALVAHPLVDQIAVTGSTPVGQQIMREAAGSLKRVSLELGGKSPNIVFADADLDAAVRGAQAGIFYNMGEICTAGSRLFVEASIHDAFLDRLLARTKKLVPMDPLDPKCRFGPQISEQHLRTILRFVEQGEQDGAAIVAGGHRVSVGDGRGFFMEPTIFDGVTSGMALAREEIFGPVLSVITFKDLADVTAQANDSLYGLAAGIWTNDLRKAHRLARDLRAGTVWINTYNVFSSASPFGGTRMSGFGRELGSAAISMYTQTKSVWVDLS